MERGAAQDTRSSEAPSGRCPPAPRAAPSCSWGFPTPGGPFAASHPTATVGFGAWAHGACSTRGGPVIWAAQMARGGGGEAWRWVLASGRPRPPCFPLVFFPDPFALLSPPPEYLLLQHSLQVTAQGVEPDAGKLRQPGAAGRGRRPSKPPLPLPHPSSLGGAETKPSPVLGQEKTGNN